MYINTAKCKNCLKIIAAFSYSKIWECAKTLFRKETRNQWYFDDHFSFIVASLLYCYTQMII